MKPFLILQLRREDAAADGEFDAFLKAGSLNVKDVHRVRMEQHGVPKVDLADYSGIVVGGGPSNVSDQDKSDMQRRFEADLHSLLTRVIEQDFPYFGACYGLGILTDHLGGTVSKDRYSEPIGAVTVALTDAAKTDPLTARLPSEFRAFVGHKEACQAVAPGAVLLATGEACPVQMIRLKQNIYASQFHPELDGPGLAVRIRVYKNTGYFPPEDAERLTALVLKKRVTVPEKIFHRFIKRYQG